MFGEEHNIKIQGNRKFRLRRPFVKLLSCSFELYRRQNLITMLSILYISGEKYSEPDKKKTVNYTLHFDI
jgi:hypothetical protein